MSAQCPICMSAQCRSRSNLGFIPICFRSIIKGILIKLDFNLFQLPKVFYQPEKSGNAGTLANINSLRFILRKTAMTSIK